MRVYLDQIGCRLNYSEMDALATQLHAAGHQPVAAPEHAQVVVFNTCAVDTGVGKQEPPADSPIAPGQSGRRALR